MSAIPGLPERTAIPPYVAYRTLQNFVNELRESSVPGQIDRSVMGGLAGGTQSQLLSAMKALGLIDANGIPTQTLHKLVGAEGVERERLMGEIVRRTYPSLFAVGFDLERATTRQVVDKFATLGASGATLGKCLAFFISAAKEANIQLSPHIRPMVTSPGPNTRVRRALPQDGTAAGADAEPADGGAGLPPTWSQLLLSKFPDFDPAWPDEVKAKWFEGFDRLMSTVGRKQ